MRVRLAGPEGVQELYLAIALGITPRRIYSCKEDAAGRFVRQMKLSYRESMKANNKAVIQGTKRTSSTASQGSALEKQHRHLLGRGGLLTVGLESKEDLKLNHMGLPGRRGCGKGNTVFGLEGGGPWIFTIGTECVVDCHLCTLSHAACTNVITCGMHECELCISSFVGVSPSMSPTETDAYWHIIHVSPTTGIDRRIIVAWPYDTL
jgi:hypothetical protein